MKFLRITMNFKIFLSIPRINTRPIYQTYYVYFHRQSHAVSLVTIRLSNNDTLKDSNPSIWGADDFRFPIFHLARPTLESDRGKKRRKFIGKCRRGGEGKKKRSTRKESTSVCRSLNWNERRFIPSNGPRIYALRKKKKRRGKSMSRWIVATAIQSEYKACSRRKSATAGIKKGVFFVPPPPTPMRNTLRRVENNLTRSPVLLLSRLCETSLRENWSWSNAWDKNLGIRRENFTDYYLHRLFRKE